MRRPSQRLDRGTLSELNITPLLDLCFVLLIIFMIITPALEQSIDLSLPEASDQKNSSAEITPDAILQVSIDKNGQVFLDKNRINLRELELAMTELMKRKPDAAVYLRADASVRYQDLVGVLDLIKRTGIKLGLATVPEAR
jgi:biopolymer transport protein ExbD